MYLLSYETSQELRSELQTAIMAGHLVFSGRELRRTERSDRAILDPAADLKELLKKIDRGHDSIITKKTRDILRELNGEELNRPYSASTYGKTESNRAQLEVARAMVLADREFGLLDPISLNLTREILDRFSGAETSISYSHVPDDFKEYPLRISWTTFQTEVLKLYLLPGRNELSKTGVARGGFRITLHVASGDVKLNLRVMIGGRGLVWSPRGLSALKKSHLKLIDELNGVLDDFAARLRWMELYKQIKPVPGLSLKQIESVRIAFGFFLRDPKALNLTCLRPGLSFGDDPLILENREGRAYLFRCELCAQPLGFEIVRDLSYSDSVDWTKPDLYRNSTIENQVNSRILDYAHGGSSLLKPSAPEPDPCRGTHYISTRTGERRPISRSKDRL